MEYPMELPNYLFKCGDWTVNLTLPPWHDPLSSIGYLPGIQPVKTRALANIAKG
jgi:hypothetical protein